MDENELLAELNRVKVLFQARAVAAAMGLPQPTKLDNRPDGSGLDDGPYLPGCAPRKRPEPKSLEETARIRAKAWETRRRQALDRAEALAAALVPPHNQRDGI